MFKVTKKPMYYAKQLLLTKIFQINYNKVIIKRNIKKEKILMI